MFNKKSPYVIELTTETHVIFVASLRIRSKLHVKRKLILLCTEMILN